MANKKITDLTADNSPASADVIIYTKDPSGTPLSRKSTFAGVIASDAEIGAIAGLTSAADKGIQFTGDGTAAVYALTTAGKALLDDANAAAQRTTLGLVAGGAGDVWVEKAGDEMTAQLLINGGADEIQLRIQLDASQSTNGLTVEDSNGNVLTGIEGRGTFFSDLNTVASNLFIGPSAGNASASGGKNIAIGQSALPIVTSAERNIAIGYEALKVGTTGSSNLAIGDASLMANVDGIYNVGIGIQTLKTNISGDRNMAVGLDALQANLADDNVAVGFQAANTNSGGSSNVAIGTYALYTNSSGSSNMAIGASALYYNNTTGQNTAVGVKALYRTVSSNNVGIGYLAGEDLTSGLETTAIGALALQKVGTGTRNTAVGYQALTATTNGGYNAALGRNSLYTNTTGGSNTAVGNAALYTNNGEGNIAIGQSAGYRQTAASNLLIIDNQARTDVAEELTNSILYGVMDAAPVNQTLRINSKVGINDDVGDGQLRVDQSSASGAMPVLELDQADVSEEFIRIVGESAADNTQSLVDAADLTTPGAIVGWFKIDVEDVAGAGDITDGTYYVPFYATPTS